MLQRPAENVAKFKKMKVKSEAYKKASQKKAESLQSWHGAMKTARQRLGIKGNILPKKGTPYYDECKRIQQERR